MVNYLLNKARKAGFDAWPEGDMVAIKLPFTVYGHFNGYSVVRVRNYDDYKALIGEEI